jgi:two-component system sensor histidine kinase EvgS
VWTTVGVVAVLLALITIMGINIARRRRAEETLRDSQQRLQVIFDAASAGIAQIRADGTFLLVNEALCRMLGYSQSELRGMNFRDITPAEDLQAEEPLIARVLASETDTFQVEKRYIRRDGSYIWTLLSSAVVRDDDGRPRYAIAVINDRTETRRLQAELAQSQKMEAIGRLAGGVAHDFNNKLQSILGYSDLLLERATPEDESYEDLQEIRTAAQQSAQLTAQLLAFARRQTIVPRVLDLNQTVEGMLKMLNRLIDEEIELTWVPHDAGAVRIDPTQLDQVLANLVVNARDAIEGVGRITIETGQATIDQAYCNQNPEATPGRYALLTVSDNGTGIPPETLASIFEPFFTTKNTTQGTGLGLATVYGVVKQNGGFIDVYSEPQQGTTFKIYLPLREEEPVAGEPEHPPEQFDRGTETILFVEDEPAILQLGRTMLHQLGYDVLTAATPQAALEQARRLSRSIDLLITDVVMPGMNGKELSRRLMSDHPHMRRLFVSGYTANVIAHRGVLEDGMHFMQKPFTQADLAVKVREVLDGE